MRRKNKRRAWRAEDLKMLRSRARNKIPASRIAEDLRRTEGAVRQKAFELGLSLETRDGVLEQRMAA